MDLKLVDNFHPKVRKQKRWIDYIVQSESYGFTEFFKEWWKFIKMVHQLGREGKSIFLLADNRKLLLEGIQALQEKGNAHLPPMTMDEIEWREIQLTWLKAELMNRAELEAVQTAVRNGDESIIIGKHQTKP